MPGLIEIEIEIEIEKWNLELWHIERELEGTVKSI